jgi:predicted site-specific integrase-resolvase
MGGLMLIPSLLTLDEAAKKYRLHTATLYRYLQAGYLKRYKKRLDRHTYVDAKELDELLKRPHFEPK